jgi:LPXTG-motif cell wall-anchored protein
MSARLVVVPAPPSPVYEYLDRLRSRNVSPCSLSQAMTAEEHLPRNTVKEVLGTGAVFVLTLLVGAGIVVGAGPAQAQTGTFRATPTSGPPGTVITVSSVTPCKLPSGVTGAPFATVALHRGSTVVTGGSFTASASGAWSGTLTVGRLAAPGKDVITAFCIASPQAEGAFLAYQDVTFTVTGPGGLAATGFDTWPWVLTAVMLMAVGIGILALRRRRAICPCQQTPSCRS